jgi:Bacterial DNA-binding protein
MGQGGYGPRKVAANEVNPVEVQATTWAQIAAAAVDVLLESMAESLKRGEELEISGIGTFSAPRTELHRAADELRGGAEELDREHQEFLRNIGRSATDSQRDREELARTGETRRFAS